MNRLLCLIFLSLLFFTSAFAQNNLSNVKVEDLTDAQVLQIVKQAESAGYKSTAQIEQMATLRGMKADEIQKLKFRIEKIKDPSSVKKTEKRNVDRSLTEDEDKEGNETDSKKAKIKSLVEAKIDTLPKVFGANLFKDSVTTFEPNLRMATPKGYVIGPDDKLIIDLTGDNEVSYDLGVSTEGIINLPYVGRIAVAGLSIEQASAKIRSAMAKTYPALVSGRTSLAINLGNIRSIKVIITGQVTKPGTYTLPSLASAFNALYHSGGPSANGSFRNIQLIRSNKVIATIDLYDYILTGIQKGNIRLQDQDVIHIPVFEKQVLVTGEVKTSALFEMKQGENLKDLIYFAGGFSSKAYTARIKVLQNTDRERKIIDIQADAYTSYLPKNGDHFVVEPILDRFQNRVEILGSVFRPGAYELVKGLTLKQLIERADGLTEDAFLNRGYINRLNKDNTQSLISFDVSKILAGTQADISLNREDKVTISSVFDLRDAYELTIQGEVRAPGTFDYADNTSLEDLIQKAGGFKEGATPNRIEISRRVKNSDAKSAGAVTAELFTINVDQELKLLGPAFILKPFDIVSVRNADGYMVQKQIKIEGEVLFPGVYTIVNKNERISDVIKRAGGLTSYAYAEGASLKRPGPEKTGPKKDKNAIDNKEEEDKKLLNLKRAQEVGVKDEVDQKLIQSDLVGIALDRILQKPNTRFDLILEDGDVIRVPKQLQTVKITGEVLNPNSIVYSPGKSLSQYINGAGGYSASALRNGVYVKYANGSASASKKFLFFNNHPKILPGAEILVPKKAERERMTAQSWIGIGTAVASLGAIIVSLLK